MVLKQKKLERIKIDISELNNEIESLLKDPEVRTRILKKKIFTTELTDKLR
jgi:hypothetical protein